MAEHNVLGHTGEDDAADYLARVPEKYLATLNIWLVKVITSWTVTGVADTRK